MTDDIAVVKPHYIIEQAYDRGYVTFEGATPLEADREALSHFKESAEWANNDAPSLRAMAGYDDAGHGTYQVNRQVAAIEPGCEEDEPAEAMLVDAAAVFEALVEAFDSGAYDAIEGAERDPIETHAVW